MNSAKYFFFLLQVVFFTISCSSEKTRNYSKDIELLDESEIVNIPLAGEVSLRKSEISGLCWNKDKLILLTQYPDRFSEDGLGKIFYLKKSQIDNFLSGNSIDPLETGNYKIDLSDYSDLFQYGSGFEAITINNDTAYFAIESLNKGKTESYIVLGKIDEIKKTIILEKNSLNKVNSKIHIHNFSNEAILFHKKKIIPIYEANGNNVHKLPEVSVFNENLELLEKISFPNIEYRITDVTSVDENDRFWAVNYLYPGEIKKLKVESDGLINEFGIGKSHFSSNPVERLVEFQFRNNRIEIVDESPIYLQLLPDDSRNWEGIVRYRGELNGFLLATDTFPETILGFLSTN